MGIRRRFVTAIAVAAVTLSSSPGTPSAVAADPAAAKVAGNSDFHFERQRTLPDGRVATTFRSAQGTLDTIGRPGMTVTVNVTDRTDPAKPREKHADVEISFQSPAVDKAARGVTTSDGASAVDSLIAIGVDPAIAHRDFDAFDGRAAQASDRIAATAPFQTGRPTAISNATVSSTVPWETKCANLSFAGGKITGRGCSTIYLVAANGSDWFFESKLLVTGSSNDTSLFPVRLRSLGWKLWWQSQSNEVYDWEPHTTVYGTGACGNVVFGGVNDGFVIQVQIPLCPTKEVPWAVAQASSGAEWIGTEHDNDPVGAAAVQKNHNPPNVTTSHTSTVIVGY